jgi:hypothetical protein
MYHTNPVQPPVTSDTLDGHRLLDVGPSIHTRSMSRSAVFRERRHLAAQRCGMLVA